MIGTIFRDKAFFGAVFEEKLFEVDSYPYFLPVSFPYNNLRNVDGRKDGGFEMRAYLFC